MSAPDRLAIYNGALRILKQRKLASATEDVEPRYLLDDVWDNGAIQYCLEEGMWKHAIRSTAIDYAPSITPNFGYRYGFNKPTDWLRTAAFCSDEYFNVPLNEMVDEAGFWYTNIIKIYVRYVSNDAAYGMNYALWPQTFQQFVQAYFALNVAPRLVQGKDDNDAAERKFLALKKDALAKDAMNGPTVWPPMGSWAGARIGRSDSRKSRWNGSNL